MDLMKLPAAERNVAFAAMNPRQKAVAIAKDVLDQLNAKKYFATEGTYLGLELAYKREDESLQHILEKESCNVCAIGATFASCVRLQNEVTVGAVRNELGSVDFMSGVMRGAFTFKELSVMEAVFEGCNISGGIPDSEEHSIGKYRGSLIGVTSDDLDFDLEYDNSGQDDLVMRALMQNIIDNDGRLKIPGVRFFSSKYKTA
jgi:hypothetical protein